MTGTGRERRREKQAPRREPDAGLDTGVPRIIPRAEGGAKPLGHRGCPSSVFNRDYVLVPDEQMLLYLKKKKEKEKKKEIAWQVREGIEGTGQYLITGESVGCNTDVSDYAQWRPLFPEGIQTPLTGV